jgi:hypothetical protein
MYDITDYTQQRAKDLNVVVFPSQDGKHKIEIYDKKSGLYICKVGALGYKDYPTYVEEEGKEYADKRRRLYHLRHKTDEADIGSRKWFVSNLLW